NGGGMAVTDQPPFYGLGVPGNNQSTNNSTGLNMEPFGSFEIQAAGGFNEWDPHGFNATYWSSDLENEPGENAWAGKYAQLNYVDPSLNIHGHTLDIERKRAHRVRFVRDSDQTSSSGTTTYSWTNDTPSIGLAATGSGDIASFTAVNSGTSPVTATIVVTPTYTNAGVSCDGPTETFTITVNPTAQVNDPVDQIICNTDTTSVTFTTENTGGTTTYAWTNDTTSIGLADLGTGNIPSFSGVNTGTSPVTANLTVTPTFTENGVSCTGPAETFTITVNPTGQVDEIQDQILCNTNATTAITFTTDNTGGTTTYSWTNDTDSIGLSATGSGDIASFNAVNNGTEPVTATIVVTPSFEGCVGPTETFTITVNPTAEMNDPEDMVVCNAEVTDAVAFTTNNTGGTTTYTWTNDTPSIGLAASGSGDLPSFTAANTDTQPITATITVTPLFTDDINCDGISETFTITVNPTAQVDDPADQIVCNGDELIVDFTTDNTIGTTTYTWISDIDIGGGLSGAGNINFTAINNAFAPVVATITVVPILDNLGIACSGPVETFTVSVNGNVDPKAALSNYNGFEISCFEANDGYINIQPTAATPFASEPSYIYQWTGPNGFSSTDQNIANLEPGIYNLSVTDSLNCVFDFEYTLNEPDLLEIIVDQEIDVLCNGVFDAQISITPTGGAAPYSYQWMKDGVLISSEEDVTGLDPGTYILILNDSNSCGPVSQIFEITQPEAIEIILDNSVDILCYGDATGSIDISVSGGTPTETSPGIFEYNYSWVGPSGFTSNLEDISLLVAGEYTVTVTDSYSCETDFSVELTQPEDLIINYTATDNTCYQSNDGSITLDIVGGVEPYDIYWSNFGNGPIQTNLSAGVYEVTVTDFNECVETVSIEIFEAPLFDIDPVVTQISCFGANDGSINLNIAGGVEPITVTWDDDPTAGEERNNLGPGTYNVLIADSSGNNCTITQSFIIIEPQEIVLNGVVENPLDCDNVNSGSIDLQVVGGTEPYSFLWSNGETTEDLFNIPAGSYSVTVTDFMECEAITQFDLYRPSDIESELEIEFIADCENAIPYQISTVVVSGGVPPYNITWSDGEVSGENNEIMTTSQNGTVIVDIVDSLGCADQIIFDVDLFEIGEPGFEYTSNGLTECETIGVGDEIFFTNTSTGDYTNLIWSFGDPSFPVEGEENPTHIYNQTGIYEVTLTVEYPYGCTYEYSETIEVTDGYGLVLPNTFTPNGDGLNDTIRPWYKCMNFIEISIYDTFGSLLYVESSTDEIYGWDGTINDKEAENGNYIIVVKAITLFGEEIEINGPVALIR
ncbi:MAG: gliding motility-associated C-terminal domain-containing protein, partial [Pelagibacterales bacterium]|nr:gliding motility-associated C-terminal domain-containing protein [Pelagibacterales bacterium]